MISTPLMTALQVTYIMQGNETDISLDVASDLLNCTYTDNIDDESDSVSITLKDPEGKWAGSWSPTRGDKVKVAFVTESRGACSTEKMTIDELKTSGRPRIFSFSAVAVPLDGTIRRTCKSRVFEGTTLQAIAKKIAEGNGLAFTWDCEEDPEYDRINQQDESDLAFVTKLAKEQGYSVKCSDETLIIFDQASYEKKDPIKTIIEGESLILSWSFEAQQSTRYKGCTVKWRDPLKKSKTGAKNTNKKDDSDQAFWDSYFNGKPTKGATVKKGSTATKQEVQQYTYEDPDVDDSGQVYQIRKRCTSLKEAERIAKAKLRELNLRQLTGSISLVGEPWLCAGSVVTLRGFGSFDGNFFIEKATHSMSSSGYVTNIEVRRVNNKY